MLLEEITEVKKELIQYAAFVERMLEKSLQGLLEKNREVLVEVIDADEPQANQREINLDGSCTTLIAQFEPKAKNLRTILMILRMNNDLERMADHAVNIAESSLFLISRPLVKPLIDLPKMGEMTIRMLADSINSFVQEDAQLARSVCERDATIDAMRDQLVRELLTYMLSDSSTIERSMHLMRVATNLERIADLCTNFGEDIVFMVQGRIIKHHEGEHQ
jgi:phosphate transport system protein